MRRCWPFVALALAVSCSRSTEPTTKATPNAPEAAPAPIENFAAGPAADDDPNCPSAVELAVAHIDDELFERDPSYSPGRSGVTADSFEPPREQPDLDGDGTLDLVLVHGSTRNVDHFFFVERARCHELVGVISVSPLMGFYCSDDRTNGLCDLRISRLMIHGETERSTWVFNGTTYEMSGRPELGPRKTKYKP